MKKINRNKEIPTYLDGFLYIYRPNDNNKSNFGAKKNVRKLSDMELVYKLAYQQAYKRLQDIEFAESSGRDLTLKVKTRLVRGIKNSDKVVIGNVLYDVITTDEDRANQELYIYLEESRVLDE